MKRLRYFLGLLIIITLALVACMKWSDPEENNNGTKFMEDLVVSQNFDWKTTMDIEVKLNGSTKSVVYINSTEESTYHKGLLFSGVEYTTKITVPTYVNNVVLVYDGQNYEVTIDNNKIEYNFN